MVRQAKKNLFKADDESCFRLMNYLFMLTIHWYAKTQTHLINEPFQCTEKGAYLPNIDKNYYTLETGRTDICIDNELTKFIARFYFEMDESTNEEVAEIAKLDPAYTSVYKTKSEEYKEMNTKEFEPYYPILYEHTIIAMEEKIEYEA